MELRTSEFEQWLLKCAAECNQCLDGHARECRSNWVSVSRRREPSQPNYFVTAVCEAETMKQFLLLFSLLGFTAIAGAAEHGAHAGADAEAGKAKSTACAACHGADGNSLNPIWPKIAGQHAEYLESQLAAFKSGERNNALMAGQVAGLSAADMANLAAYFAGLEQSPGVADEAQVPVAEAIWRGGKADKGVPACSACHGPQGLGNGPAAYPRISGQHAAYTAASLKAYRDGSRAGTAQAQMMSQVAQGLSDEDIEALASYISGLH